MIECFELILCYPWWKYKRKILHSSSNKSKIMKNFRSKWPTKSMFGGTSWAGIYSEGKKLKDIRKIISLITLKFSQSFFIIVEVICANKK